MGEPLARTHPFDDADAVCTGAVNDLKSLASWLAKSFVAGERAASSTPGRAATTARWGDGRADPHGALLQAAARGDEAAADALAVALLPRILNQASRMLGSRDEAEDVAQEALLRLWRAAPGWRIEGAKVSTWTYAVTANLCVDRLRRRRHGTVALDLVPEPPDAGPTTLDSLQSDARARALARALADLPDRQAQAVALRHLEGLSTAEVAEVMDIGEAAVESLVARGRRALAQALEPDRAALGFEGD